jgi:ABC-2 type transport system ATP-binding protein
MQDGPDIVLRFDRIEKIYRSGWRRRVHALRGVSLDIHAGEVIALLGHNGAGKTTLMKLALGLLRPTRGGGEVFGRPLGDVRARRDMGFQPEQPYLYPFLTARETLRLFGQLAGLQGRALSSRISDIAARTGLAPALETQVRRLSRGWLQRLALAGALSPNPRLLLLDEPLSGLDPQARIDVKSLIRALRAEGRTVLLNSHVLPDVEQVADRVALLRDGRLIACGRLDELLDPQAGGVEVEFGGAIAPGLTRIPGARCLWEHTLPARARWWLPALPPQELQRALRTVMDAGGALHALVPQREPLERFFERMMRTAEPCTGAESPAEPQASGAEDAA